MPSVLKRAYGSGPCYGLITALCILPCASLFTPRADALELTSVAAIYTHKKEALKEYEIAFALEKNRFEANGSPTVSGDKYYSTIAVSDSRYRLENFATTVDERIQPVAKETYSAGEFRYLSYTEGGSPDKGYFMAKQEGEVFTKLIAGPLASAGLANSDSYFDPSKHANRLPYPFDVGALANSPLTELGSDTETIDGMECFVLRYPQAPDPVLFRVWLAADFDLALVRGEIYDAGGDFDGMRTVRISAGEFREVVPGLHIPTRSVLEGYSNSDAKSRVVRDDVAWSHEFRIDTIDLSPEFPDDHFMLEFPDGISLWDRALDVTFKKGYKAPLVDILEDDVESIVSKIERNEANERVFIPEELTSGTLRPPRSARSERSAIPWRQVIVGALLATVVLMGVSAIRNRSKRV